MNKKIKDIVKHYLEKEMTKEVLLQEAFGEKSFQHVLGEYLKKELGSDYIVQYERNIKYFNCFRTRKFSKTEADIVVLKKEKNNYFYHYSDCVPIAIIEIKFVRKFSELHTETASPTNALKNHFVDIAFCNELKSLKDKTVDEALSLLLCDYNFTAPTNCIHKELWNAYYEGSINKTSFKKIISNINCSKSSTKQQKNALSNLKSGAWMDNFKWKKTKVDIFADEGNNVLKLQYMLV